MFQIINLKLIYVELYYTFFQQELLKYFDLEIIYPVIYTIKEIIKKFL